jgi:hypothetical protein
VQTASINDPFIPPPLPPKLPKSATEAEKQKRAALMRERKRCRDAVNHAKRNAKRAKGADRTEKQVDSQGALNAKRAKSGDADGHRDNAVAKSIRRGLPECDSLGVR